MSEKGMAALAALMACVGPDIPRPGIVYRHFDADGVLLYVGSTERAQLRERQLVHARSSRWWRFVRRVDVDVHPDRAAAQRAETTAIRSERAVFNRNCGVTDQPEREADYLAQHAAVEDTWTPTCQAMRGLPPVVRRERIDAMLAAVGFSATPTRDFREAAA